MNVERESPPNSETEPSTDLEEDRPEEIDLMSAEGEAETKLREDEPEGPSVADGFRGGS